jgi:squalene-associated FAD-dependent desaturase
MSGLAAAVAVAGAGHPVSLYEAAGHGGGRCRSFFDPTLGRFIDNGNHLVLSGNRSVSAYLRTIGATDQLCGPARAEFPFVDLATGERWTVAPGRGPLPWWILSPGRRIPGTRARDYVSALRLAWARPTDTVADCLPARDLLFERFWEPLTIAALNAPAATAAAALLWAVVRETFGRGEAACRPRIAVNGLSTCFVEPALAYLGDRGGVTAFHRRLTGMAGDGDIVDGLHFADNRTVTVTAGEAVILAVPPEQAATLVPGVMVPHGHQAIVNLHFRCEHTTSAPQVIGVVGGLTQWLFVRDGVLSVTISAADAIVDDPREALAARVWDEVRRVLERPGGPLPPCRIVKEKRATFAATPDNVGRRPGPRTRWRNAFLAGDWTDTALPATLEASIRSGVRAANAALTVDKRT